MGPYDNELGMHVESDEWMDGQWLADDDGSLYIIPIDGDGVEGPDDDVAAAILKDLRVSGEEEITEDRAAELGLTIVAPSLKRFDADTGYHTA